MAYGLDFEEIYYTDHERTDIGVLETYEIDADLADEKDFQITSPDCVIPIGGFWYIPKKEYGGIVDGFETDSDEKKVVYTGRTFRGILHSHILDVDGKYRHLPAESIAAVDEDGAIVDTDELIKASISDTFREVVRGFDDLFIVDEPFVDEAVDIRMPSIDIKAGTSVYDALVQMADSIQFSFLLEYHNTDKKVHIIPILERDYVDYLKGSKYEGLGFTVEISEGITNHIIYSAEEEDGSVIYRMHFFTDENGGLQPYAFTDNPIKDADYILDKRSQVLFGLDEIAEYEEVSVSAKENYEPLYEAPPNWDTEYGNYFERKVDEETGQVSYNEIEGVEVIDYTPVTTQPADWATNYSQYFWASTDAMGNTTYTNYAATTALDYAHKVKLSEQPPDWKQNYSNYYYPFKNGTTIEYRPYEGKQKDTYVLMTSRPSDWASNFGSYYRKVFKKKDSKGKITLIDTTDAKGEYVTCKKDDDGKGTGKPSFEARRHYRKDTVTVAPQFKKNKTYYIPTIEVLPTFDAANTYVASSRYVAPDFVAGEVYKKWLDHYAGMVEDAKKFFEEKRKQNNQSMELEDFPVNIGDVVGGTDEFTKTSIVGKITNIEVRIENGLIDATYSVKVGNYTTTLNPRRSD